MRASFIKLDETKGIEWLTRHGGQTRVRISHSHAEAEWVETACRTITGFFKTLTTTTEQLTPVERWCRVLSQALTGG